MTVIDTTNWTNFRHLHTDKYYCCCLTWEWAQAGCPSVCNTFEIGVMILNFVMVGCSACCWSYFWVRFEFGGAWGGDLVRCSGDGSAFYNHYDYVGNP